MCMQCRRIKARVTDQWLLVNSLNSGCCVKKTLLKKVTQRLGLRVVLLCMYGAGSWGWPRFLGRGRTWG
ncbi:hypothetical protein P167DRAFT_87658 [Morchella conica CCBAS932]|uniref:Uncharacterized protein n=1 Tax=Morchella conica CCBAS932 TaxID=1392247 RepID=A0A3N4L023_9PEZI|nr:hypothetical protein P167DRAFT_87658 [Morchella conica CCBAS932]